MSDSTKNIIIENIINDALKKLERMWSDWQPIPPPETCRKIDAPKGSGVYQIRNKKNDKLILFGIGKECQKRMKSLYPSPHGTGTRNNVDKREYVLKNWKNLEYRTMETNNRDEAEVVEKMLKAKNNHYFNT